MLRQRNRAVNKSNSFQEARGAIANSLRTSLYFSILSSQRLGSKTAGSELRSAGVEYGISSTDKQEALLKASTIANRYAAYWLTKAEESNEDSESARATKASSVTYSRLETIAITESAIAYNIGKQLVYPTDDSVLYRVWDSTFDQNTCQICSSADGDKVLINENFPRGEPGEVHPNCRCTYSILTEVEANRMAA